jgi:hypothetical protein
MRVRPILLALRRNAASQEGVALMEAVMSAAVLILVVLGVLAAMDAVSGTAGANQARTVAAALAERDQERLRGLATEELEDIAKSPRPPEEVTVGNVKYTIASEVRWVTDAAGEDASCALENGEGSYLRIRSTVTSPVTGAAVKPVVLTGIVAPRPGSGTLAALVKNAGGQPLSGIRVAISGPEAADKLTNAVGCAVFTGLDAGTYNATLNQAPYIGEDGKQLTVKSVTVTAGNVATVEFVYDRKSSLNVQVYTILNGLEVADQSRGVIAANAKVPAGFVQAQPVAPATTASSFSFPSVFPFQNPYTVYAGTCLGADPSKVIPNYFDLNPQLVVTLAPGVPGPTVRVLEPAVDVLVRRAPPSPAGSPPVARDNARVYVYPLPRQAPDVVPECGTRFELTTDSARTGSLAVPPLLGNLPPGRVAGLPFGQYEICAEYRNGSGNYFHKLQAFTNDAPNGKLVTIDLPNSPSGGNEQCPPA